MSGCEWKIGDTFAYPLDAEIWKDTDFYGDYLIMQKVGERNWSPGHTVPVVRVKITENKQIPHSLEEIEALRYVIFFKRKGEKESNYMLALGNTSKRKIPKKIIFIGNYDIFKAPNDEEKVDFNDNYLYYEWKFFDIYVHDKVKKNLFSKVL